MDNGLDLLVAYAHKLDKNKRYDLAENIESHISDINFVKSMYQVGLNITGCNGCQRYSHDASDFLEDEEIKNIQKSIGSEEDINDTNFYSDFYGDLDTNSEMGKRELLKSLLLEWEITQEEWSDMLLYGGVENQNDQDKLSALSERLEHISREINQLRKSKKSI